MFHNNSEKAGIIIGVICLILFSLFFGSWLAWLLWNGIIVSAFHAPHLSFWQIFGIKILISCLLPTHISNNNNSKN